MSEEEEVKAVEIPQDPNILSIDTCPSCGEPLAEPPLSTCAFSVHIGPREEPRQIDS